MFANRTLRSALTWIIGLCVSVFDASECHSAEARFCFVTPGQPPTPTTVACPGLGAAGVDVWVLNPDAFVKFLDSKPAALSAEDVGLLSAALETHIRASR